MSPKTGCISRSSSVPLTKGIPVSVTLSSPMYTEPMEILVSSEHWLVRWKDPERMLSSVNLYFPMVPVIRNLCTGCFKAALYASVTLYMAASS